MVFPIKRYSATERELTFDQVFSARLGDANPARAAADSSDGFPHFRFETVYVIPEREGHHEVWSTLLRVAVSESRSRQPSTMLGHRKRRQIRQI